MVRISEDKFELSYKCKICGKYVTIILYETELNELKNGLPFNAVFPSSLDEPQVTHFKFGVCKDHVRIES